MKNKILTAAAVLAAASLASAFSWDGAASEYFVNTGLDNGTETSGYWYSFDDNAEGGLSTIIWPVALGNEYSEDALDPVIDACGGVCMKMEHTEFGRIEVFSVPLPESLGSDVTGTYTCSGRVLVAVHEPDKGKDWYRVFTIEDDGTGICELFSGEIPQKPGANGIRWMCYADNRRVLLGDYVLENPENLAYGLQRKLEIARALAADPEIIYFDEPTSALDPELTGEVLKVIRGLKNADSTMIIVTHEMEFARNVSDKIIFMANGVIEEEGTPEEVFGDPKSEKLRSFLANSRNK